MNEKTNTLAEYSDDCGDHVETLPSGCKVVYADRADRAGYFHLSDYSVSTATAVCLFMVPKL